MSRLAALLGMAGAMLLAVGLGLGVGPASAHGGGDQVTASVNFHDPDCDDQSASWHGLVNGQADAEGDGVTFAVTAGVAEPGKEITVTATAEAGFVFEGGASTKTFTHTFGAKSSDCGHEDVVVTPSVKFHNPDAEDGTASWTGYVNGVADGPGDGVKFKVTSGTVAPGATVTISAFAQDGFVFPGGETCRTFTHTFTKVGDDEDTVVTPTVEFTNPSKEHAAGWAGFVNGTPDNDHDGVTFEITAGTVAPGATVTVTATAEAGFVFPGGATTKTFTHTFTKVTGEDTCVTPTVEFTNPTGDHAAGWAGFVNGTPDNDHDGVTFEVTAGTVAPGATVTITATAEAGFVFPGGATTKTFTHTFTKVTGDVTVVATVKFTNATKHHAASWAGFVNGAPDNDQDGVTFEVTAGTVAPGATVTITATAEAGYVLQGGVQTLTFTHTFPSVEAVNLPGSGPNGNAGGNGSGTASGGVGSGGVGSSGGNSAGTVSGTALGNQSVVPTSVEAGLPGKKATSTMPQYVAALLLAGGAVLLLASGWLMTRDRKHGAHRA